MQELLPFFLTLFSAVFGISRRLLSMRFTLKQGYIRKIKVFVSEKVKIIDEAEINLQTVDKSGNLLPRKVNKNANIVKRYRAIHEGTERKKVIAKSQVKAVTGPTALAEPDDDLFVPYKKVSFLPAYFYKVFIKKPKPEEAKTLKKGAKPAPPVPMKRDPKTGKMIP